MSDLKNGKMKSLSEDDLGNVSGGKFVVVDTSRKDKNGNYVVEREFDSYSDARYYATMERSYKLVER